MKKGMADEIKVLTDSRQWDNIVDFNEDSATYDTISATLKAVLPSDVTNALDIIDPRVKFNIIDIPNDPKTLAENPIEVTDVKTEALSSSTIRSYATLQGYAVEHPEVRQYFTYQTDTESKSFFAEDGTLGWNAIAANRSAFTNSYSNYNRDFPDQGLAGFQDAYETAAGDGTIDLSSIPKSADPALPPRPPNP